MVLLWVVVYVWLPYHREQILIQRDGIYGNVVRFEIVDEDVSYNPITVVSGNSTTENQYFLNGLRDSALETFPDGGWYSNGPEGLVRTIRLVCERGDIELISWHPLEGGVGDIDDPAYVARRDKSMKLSSV